MEQAAAKAPWVTFKKVSQEDRNASIEAGSYIAVDVDYAFITPPGSKDCVERPVKEWFESLRQQVENQRFPGEWLAHFERMYDAWAKSEELPVEGTAVKNWSVASPAQIEMLLKLHVRTVEQLADSNEEVIGRLGMGGRSLVDSAKAFVKQQGSGIGALAAENSSLRVAHEEAKTTIATMEENLKLLQAQVAALQGAQVGMASASSSIDAPAQSTTVAGDVTLADLLDKQATPSPATARKL